MDVLDFEDRAWVLLKDNDNYFIDVNCNNSAFGFSMLICLEGEELTIFYKQGHKYIDKLAKDIAHHSISKYGNRDKSTEYSKMVSNAINSWKLKDSN